VPIALEAWHGGRRRGLLIAALASACWFLVHTQERLELPVLVRLWNGAVRMSFFTIAAALLARLRAALTREETLARYDALTGALNRRFFYLLAQREILRARRQGQPLTIAYLDLDNFKQVNDTHGHEAGDELLRRFVELVRQHIRGTDLIARLGGDEFALLFPDTAVAGGRHVLDKLQELVSAQLADSPVTLSIGALTFAADVPDIEELVHRADELMYRLKRGGKNAIEFQVVG
jgi:diguanylate cyclase (GGDEF)-like protein